MLVAMGNMNSLSVDKNNSVLYYVLHDSAKKFGTVELFVNDNGKLDFLSE